MRGLIYAPGERYVVAHRPQNTPTGLSQDSTGCGLPVSDGWQILPPELSTPICAGCTAALRSPSREATPAPQPPQAPVAQSPLTEAPSAAPESLQPAPRPTPEEPPEPAPKEPPHDTWARIRRFVTDFTRSRTDR